MIKLFMTIEHIQKRALIIRSIRDFFSSLNYLELETPTLSQTLIPESNLEIFETEITNPFKENIKSYMIPSPEVWLKMFLSENPINIFEISRCFRNSEQSGRQHNPEFTMLEYYSIGFDYKQNLELTKKFLNYLNKVVPGSKLPDNHIELTMENAFKKYAGFSLKENYSINMLKQRSAELGIFTEKDDNWETAFNRIFIDKVEPNLPTDVNLFLTDFPSQIKTLAKNIPGTIWAQRWELYINGIECGNCYTEETDPKLIKDYFIEETDVKHKVDMDYPLIFKSFPKCSGGAIGVDRLIMEILGIDKIQGVILFPHRGSI